MKRIGFILFCIIILFLFGCVQNSLIMEAMKNWKPPKTKMTKEQIKDYYSVNKEKLNPIEGIWIYSEVNDKKFDLISSDDKDWAGKGFNLNAYKVAVMRNSKDADKFVVIYYESLKESINYGEIKGMFYSSITPETFEYRSVTFLSETQGKKTWTTFTLSDDNNRLFGVWDAGLDFGVGSLKARFKISYIKESSTFEKKDLKGVVYSGSGSLISESGLVITNYHIIEDKSEISVLFPQLNKEYFSEIVLKDKNNDIAVLRLRDFNYSEIFSNPIPFTISHSSKTKLGEDVYTLGFPLGDFLGKSAKFSSGKINSLFGIQDDPRVYQISNPVQLGNSGGALFNSNGEYIGIVFSSLNSKFFFENTDIIPQNVNFAIKSNYLLNLISLLPDEKEITSRTNSLSGISTEKQIELLQPFIVNIKAK